jgi:hypothetical protein
VPAPRSDQTRVGPHLGRRSQAARSAPGSDQTRVGPHLGQRSQGARSVPGSDQTRVGPGLGKRTLVARSAPGLPDSDGGNINRRGAAASPALNARRARPAPRDPNDSGRQPAVGCPQPVAPSTVALRPARRGPDPATLRS